MLPLARNGYTEQEIKDALHGKKGARKMRFRYDLLDKNENKIAVLNNVEGGEVSFAALNDIKRTAQFNIVGDAKEIPRKRIKKYPVTWVNLVGVEVIEGGNLRKTAANAWDNGGATSKETIESGNGWVEMKAVQMDFKMFGLSNGNSDSHYGDIDYAIYTDMQNLLIYEKGAHIATVGTHTIGDVLKVAVENGVVKYYKNSELLYTSLQVPVYPLLLDVSIYSPGGILNNVLMVKEEQFFGIDWLSDRIQPFVELEMNIKEEEGTTNFLANPDFDGTGAWALYTNGGGTFTTSGGWGKLNISDAGSYYFLSQQINRVTKANQEVTFSVTFKNNVVGRFALRLVMFEGEDVPQQPLAYVDLDGKGGTKRGYVTAKHTRETTGLRADILAGSVYGASDISVEFDKAQLEEKPKATSFVLGSRVERPKWIEFPVGVFLLSSPEKADTTGGVKRSVEAYDGTIILRDDRFDDVVTVTAGTNYKTAIVSFLQGAGITKYIIADTEKVLPVDLQFEIGTTKLSAINALLAQINFTPIRVDANGFYISGPYISPNARGIDYTYKDDALSVTHRGMVEQMDIFDVANKWVVVRTNAEELPLKSVYTNSAADSETSTTNRGRTIVDYREIDNIADQTALDAYTQRIAFEASQVFGKVEFTTAIMPMHDYFDVLKVEYAALNIDAKYSETAWNFPLVVGGRMKHEVRRVVNI